MIGVILCLRPLGSCIYTKASIKVRREDSSSGVGLGISESVSFKQLQMEEKRRHQEIQLISVDFFLKLYILQLLRVQHNCSFTPSWGSLLPSIAETRDQNSWGCPLLFSKRIFFVHRGQRSYTPTSCGTSWTTPGERCMKHASS